MKRESVSIIGAGIAGLAAGCYLQMNGYKTKIFEKHDKPGGLVASWKRKGYLIQGGFPGLAGSAAANPFFDLWCELLDMNNVEFIYQEKKDVFEFPDGNRFHLYCDLDKLETYVREISPSDSTNIGKLTNGAKRFRGISLPIEKPREHFGVGDYLGMMKMLPLLPFMKKWLNTSAEAFAGKFENPFLRKSMRSIHSPVLYEMMILSVMDQRAAGYPLEGVTHFAEHIEKRYLSLGGDVNYNRPAKEILVKDNLAIGLKTKNGKQELSDIVVSAADGKTTLERMLGGMFTSRKLARLFEQTEVNSSRILVCLGISDSLDQVAFKSKYILEKPLTIADGITYESINTLKFSDMPSVVPAGKSLLRVELETRGGRFWIDLRNENPKKYREQKDRLAGEIIELLDGRIQGLKTKIDMIDVATPATFERYTGNWKGSIQGWQAENIFKSNPFRKELKGLSNFYMCGQWVEPGCGVPLAALSGRNVAQIICRKDKKRFEVSSPGHTG